MKEVIFIIAVVLIGVLAFFAFAFWVASLIMTGSKCRKIIHICGFYTFYKAFKEHENEFVFDKSFKRGIFSSLLDDDIYLDAGVYNIHEHSYFFIGPINHMLASMLKRYTCIKHWRNHDGGIEYRFLN